MTTAVGAQNKIGREKFGSGCGLMLRTWGPAVLDPYGRVIRQGADSWKIELEKRGFAVEAGGVA